MQMKLLAVALAAIGAVGSAQAGVMGQSVLEITNFQFLNPNSSVINANQFSQLAFNDSSTATANLNNVVATQSMNQNTFGTLNLPQQCVGACGGFVPDDYSHRTGSATVNVARADTLLQGSPIINSFGVSAPADAHVVNEGQLATITGFGAIQSNLGLTASFAFQLLGSQTVTISFNSLSHLIANVDLGSFGTARASEQWVIDIFDNTSQSTVFSWSPDGLKGGLTGVGTVNSDNCNLQAVRNAQIPGTTNTYDCSGTHSATTGTLTAGTLYTLGLRHAGAVDVSRVPEPSSLLLAGLALAGLGFGASRRKSA